MKTYDYQMGNMKFMDANYADGRLLFFDTLSKEFYSFDMNKEELSHVKLLERDGLDMECPRRIIRDRDDLYIIQASSCVIYHFKCTLLGLVYVEKIIAEEFEGGVKEAFLYVGMLWIIPTSANKKAAVLDIMNNHLKYVSLTNKGKVCGGLFDAVVCDNSYLYISFMEGSNIYRIDMIDESIRVFDTGISEAIGGIAFNKGNVLLRVKGGDVVYSYDLRNNTVRTIAKKETKCEEFGRVRVLNNGTIILCPVYGNDFYYIDDSNKKILPVKVVTSISRDNSSTFTIGTVEHNESLYVFPWSGEKMVKISKHGNCWEAREIPFVMSEENYILCLKDRMISEQIIMEQENMSIREFVKLL